MADRAGKRETGKSAVKPAGRSLRKPRPAVSRADLEEAFNSITHLVMLLSSDFKIKWANKATATFLKLPMSMITGSYCYTLMHGTYSPPGACPLAKMMQSKKHEEAELYIDQKKIWARVTADPQYDKKGKLVNVVHTVNDITRSRQVEEELRRLASVVHYSSELVNLASLDGKMIFLNEAGSNMLGIDRQEVDRFNVMQVIPDHLKEKVQSELLPALMNGDTWQGDLQYRNLRTGLLTDVHAMTFVVKDASTGTPLYLANVSLDLTERKKTEQALRESEVRFRRLSENAPDIIYRYRVKPDRGFEYISPAAARISGYTAEEFYADPLLTSRIVHAEDRDQYAHHFRSPEALRTTLTLRWIHKDGRVIWAEEIDVPVYDANGELIVYEGIVRDVTTRKQIEEALRVSEEKYRKVVENALEAILIAVDGVIVFTNRGTEILTGYAREYLISRPFVEFIHADDRDMVFSRHLARIKGGDIPNIYSFRIVDKAGNTKWLELSTVLITWEGRPATLNFMTDITDRRRLEEERQRVEKLKSVGVLAGGIAHDFNNILTAILGNISLARMEAEPGSEIQESLGEAEKASLRAKDLTKQLLTFSKGGAPVTKLASLTELLKDTAGFALRGSDVKCRFSIPDDLWHAEIDAGQVSQVIHNLVINAQQAMPTGGTIGLTAENMALSDTQSIGKGLPLKAGAYIRIAVVDHGTGIPADHLEKIFDPFFTTKQKGSGLGLATSFSIARNHGGHLSVESEPGRGSTFYLYLPASSQTVSLKQEKKETIKPAGKARILVMDDEKVVREVAGRMLNHLGYQDVEFACDGAEAIKLYKGAMESGNPFSVVLLDLTIPGGVGGKETVKKLLKIDPSVKAIVSSGYIDNSVISEYRENGFSGMVAKPYTIDELGKVLLAVIG